MQVLYFYTFGCLLLNYASTYWENKVEILNENKYTKNEIIT